jgi:hypothetical protein
MSNKLFRQNFLKSATIKYLTETPAAAENPFSFHVQLLLFLGPEMEFNLTKNSSQLDQAIPSSTGENPTLLWFLKSFKKIRAKKKT